MYLTAHHIVSPTTRREGINTFLYLHADQAWEHLWLPDVVTQNPGILQAQSISIAPPGNSVRSYIDIVAPDDVHWERVHDGLMEFVAFHQFSPLPWADMSQSLYFRVGMEFSLSDRWQKELAVLYRAAQALWMAHST